MVSVPSRPGVTQSFLIVDMAEAKPQAIALLYTGGGGRIGLRREQGELKFRGANFLVRAAPHVTSSRNRPALTSGAHPLESATAWMCPPSSAFIDSALPLNGTWVHLMPRLFAICSMVMWRLVPAPGVP